MATPEYLWSRLYKKNGPRPRHPHNDSWRLPHRPLNNSRPRNYKCNRLEMDESWKSIKMLSVSAHLRSGKNVQEFPELRNVQVNVQEFSRILIRKNIVFCSFLVHCTEISVHNFCTFRIKQILYILKNVRKKLYIVQKTQGFC